MSGARTAAALAVGALALSACAAAPDPRIEAARAYVREVTGDDLKAGGLRVTIRTAVGDGRTVRINGTIENRYRQRVEGVRYTVRFLTAGDPPQVKDTVRVEVDDTVLDPGETHAMRVEVEDTRHASAPGRFAIEAVPMKLDGHDPPPPG